ALRQVAGTVVVKAVTPHRVRCFGVYPHQFPETLSASGEPGAPVPGAAGSRRRPVRTAALGQRADTALGPARATAPAPRAVARTAGTVEGIQPSSAVRSTPRSAPSRTYSGRVRYPWVWRSQRPPCSTLPSNTEVHVPSGR